MASKGAPATVEVIAAFQAAAVRHEVVKTLEFVAGQAEGQAQFAQIAVRTGGLDDCEGDGIAGGFGGHQERVPSLIHVNRGGAASGHNPDTTSCRLVQ
jgi:hypothetical protein